MTEPGVSSTKEFDVNKLAIVNSDGKELDINDIFVSLEIKQSIWSPVMWGSLVLVDVKDILSNFYFSGSEYLTVDIDVPTLGVPVKKKFKIDRISDRVKERIFC